MTRKEKAELLPEEVNYKAECVRLKETILKDMPFLPEKNVEITHTYGIAPDNLVRSGGFMISISNGKKGKDKRTINIISEATTEKMMEGGILSKIDELELELASYKISKISKKVGKLKK
jgi:hypothetical protein